MSTPPDVGGIDDFTLAQPVGGRLIHTGWCVPTAVRASAAGVDFGSPGSGDPASVARVM
jgi:hypothetical protein